MSNLHVADGLALKGLTLLAEVNISCVSLVVDVEFQILIVDCDEERLVVLEVVQGDDLSDSLVR